jgi:hypothetical protein
MRESLAEVNDSRVTQNVASAECGAPGISAKGEIMVKGSGVYTLINEHSESIFNDVSPSAAILSLIPKDDARFFR